MAGPWEVDRWRVLAEAGELLAASLDYATTLASVAQLAVPTLADWCGVDLVDADGAIRRLALAHADPALLTRAQALRERYPDSPDGPTGVPLALRTGRAHLTAEITDEQLAAATRDADHLALLRDLAPRSAMIVPLVARGRTLGALTFILAGAAERRYTPADLALAEGLARIAALAVDNARLYEEAQRAAEEAQAQAARLALLADASRAFAEAGLDLPAVLDRVARQVVASLGDTCVIRLLSADGRWLEPVAVYHPDPEARAFGDAMLARAPERADEGLNGRVMRTGEPVFLPVVDQDAFRAAIKPEYREYFERFGTYSVLIVPLRARGRVLGVLSIARETPGRPYTLADQRLLEELAERAAVAVENGRLYGEAQEAARARDAFLATVSHDLKSPLSTVKGSAQLLRRQAARGDAPDLARRVDDGAARIEATADKMAALIDELLDAARLAAGHGLDLDLAPTNLVALAAEAVAAQGRDAGGRRVALETALTELTGRWDRARLERVLDNLLSNAVKYSRDGGAVTVRVDRDGGGAVLAVRDAGVGIPAADLPRIFERFHRGGNVAGRIAGTGLGLAGAREIVERHGGTIEVDSREGAGTTVTVRLPLTGPADPPTPDARPAAEMR
ncbi:MAG TPA: GAF domain-containing sensor histidine kinase [Thermomicrobiales bacterium]|nr:GAF domain-containing sensor histidine kinase [Thermomicrobiales bacterium]